MIWAVLYSMMVIIMLLIDAALSSVFERRGKYSWVVVTALFWPITMLVTIISACLKAHKRGGR